MREITLSPSAINHPQYLPDGSTVWVEAGIRERIQHGDPAMGWAGDPRIEVYLDGRNRLCLWRFENGTHNCIMRSKPNLPLDARAIQFLIDHDTNRGYSALEDVTAANAQAEKQADYAMAEKFGPAHERLFWAMRKDDKTGAGW